jgi:hypothetical protein
MNTRNAVLLFIIAVLLSIAVYYIAPPVSAITLGQGSIAYLGETVDLSLALSWPDFKIAWCKGSYYGCVPPDQVIEITGNMHNYYLDPGVFRTGTYYRWDGQWNRGENALAFKILPGTRPNTTVNTTIPGSNQSFGNGTKTVSIEGPYHFIVARGDDPELILRIPRTDQAHMWMFGATKYVIDSPIVGSDYTYSYRMSPSDTFSTNPGEYKGYLQFNGINKIQDVYWNTIDKCLDTPYDDAIIPDVCPNLNNPANIKSLFEQLVHDSKYSDDVLVPVTMQVTEPEIVISDAYQDSDTLWISGKTTWGNGTAITIKLDEDNYKLPIDQRMHTWTVTATGGLSEWRTFSTAVKVNMKDMYIGVHELKLTVNKNKYVTNVIHNFRITDTFIMPTPTPETKRVFTDMNGTPVPTPTPIITTIAPTPVSTPTIVKNSTPRITPTPAKPAMNVTAKVTANETIPVIPLSPITVLVSIGIYYIWRFRRQ